MRLKRMVTAVLASSVLLAGLMPAAFSEGEKLYSEKFDMTNVKADKEDGIIKEIEVPDGDYKVTVTTGGKTETNANIYINGGERIRAYTLKAGEIQKDEQAAVPENGKITVQIIGENPNVTEIKVEQLEKRERGEKITVYIAGDSTAQTYDYAKVYPQTGWGQVFSDRFTDDIIIENRSIGGRSAKSYNNDGRLDRILTEMHPGDYVFIQFGINDGDIGKPERYISVEDYTALIKDKYLGEVEKRGGVPVLMTASAASWWDDENNSFMESRADYAEPTREIARETGCLFIDANRIETDLYNSIGKEDVLSGYFICEPLESKVYPSGTDDHTHLKAKGAKRMALLIADEISEKIPELAKYRRTEKEFEDIEGHWAEKFIRAAQEKGFAEGDGSFKFDPDANVTRAEFLKMAMDASGIPGHAYREGECLDAAADDWYCYYLQGALDKDLIPKAMIGNCKAEETVKILAEAKEDKEAVTASVNIYTGTFDGNKPITREEMAAVAVNCRLYAAENDTLTDTGEKIFEDEEEINEEYRENVSLAYGELIYGMGDGRFAPKDNLTRAQAAVIITKLSDLLNGR